MLEFNNVSFAYGKKEIFKNFSLSADDNVSTVILGPSGFGKTTLLELASGFLKPQEGEILPFCGKPSFVFQEDRLLPWCTALQNLTAVNIEKKRALEYLKKVGLEDCAEKYPDELSGGMCRRLSIARALAFGGDVFYFDEPLRGLDIRTSGEILELIRKETEGKTLLIITHSPKEAFFLGERILVIGENPLKIVADRKISEFRDEDELSDFLEGII